ncbi:hypothetical protein [Erysipelothrix aquatica]|uniref:hypothetical protein n=1 Tax=Erysipelothrix aquatica TaxID=2683714 RepID=UPI001359FD3D|nr:hypothetical protein [Erysipelothrix aquatica]
MIFDINEGEKNSIEFESIKSDVYNAGVRRLIEETFNEMGDKDGNFIEQFKTTGFNQRLTEMYAFQALKELNFEFNNGHSVPDFVVNKNGVELCIEVTTANKGSIQVEDYIDLDLKEQEEYKHNYVQIRVGSALTSKLKKEYWKLDHCKGKPIVLLIQNFFDDSVFFSPTPIANYLYGRSESASYDESNQLVISVDDIQNHEFQSKIIESGFFNLDESKNISAVIYTNAGTIAKFRRMSYQIGYKLIEPLSFSRTGDIYNPAPNVSIPKKINLDFQKYCSVGFIEQWCDELNVFHNPNALYPVNDSLFLDAVQHRVANGQTVTSMDLSRPHFFSSLTSSFPLPVDIGKYENLEFMMKSDFYKFSFTSSGLYKEIAWIKVLNSDGLYAICAEDFIDHDYSFILFKNRNNTLEICDCQINMLSLAETFDKLNTYSN